MSFKKEMRDHIIIDEPAEFKPLKEYFEEIFDIHTLESFFRNKKLIYLENKYRELYVVNIDLLEYVNKMLISRKIRIMSLGLFAGFIKGDKFIPSPQFLEELYALTGRFRGAIVAKEKGVKAFLYGNDLLYESVHRIYKPFKKDYIVGVIDRSDMRVIGVGRAAVDLEEIRGWINKPDFRLKPVVYNEFDLGFFLREQKEYIE
ncbi:MAG: PUA domain-containing protein [Sulfolobales archaeon]|jgi:ribosome biogenesis protein Nip4